MSSNDYKIHLETTSSQSADMTLTYQFYQAIFEYNYQLIETAGKLTGKDDRGDVLTVKILKQNEDGTYNLEIKSVEEGEKSFLCKQENK
ncbi:MAG: hypothetical protein H6623_05920 [Bdellovibrionaceae bacterium]|nr:hypothetical protein [Pseudobdellovibrionaceae bacterium]